MTQPNPITTRIARTIDPRRNARIRRAAIWGGIALGAAALGALSYTFLSVNPNLAPGLVLLALGLLASLTIPAAAAVLAAGVIHRDIASEAGDPLLLTPLEARTIAEGAVAGARLALAPLEALMYALLPVQASCLAGIALLTLALLGEPIRGSSAPVPLITQSGFAVALMAFGPVAAVVAGLLDNTNYELGLLAGVASAFRLRAREAPTVTASAGGLAAGLTLAGVLGCVIALALPSLIVRYTMNILIGLALAIAVLLVVAFGLPALARRMLWKSLLGHIRPGEISPIIGGPIPPDL